MTLHLFLFLFLQEYYLDLSIRDVCGSPANLSFEAYARGGGVSNGKLDDSNGTVWRCRDEQGNLKGLGCVGDFVVIVDRFPASPLPPECDSWNLIMLKPDTADDEHILKSYLRLVDDCRMCHICS